MYWTIKHRGLNRHQRRSQYAVSSRSKPHARKLSPQEQVRRLRGREKIMRLIARGIRLNAKVIQPNAVVTAVKHGIQNMLGRRDV